MTRYEFLVMVHVVAVVAWFGGGIALVVLHGLAVRARDYAALAVVVEQSRALGKVVFFPASIVTVVSGVLLVATEDRFAFGDCGYSSVSVASSSRR